MKHLIPSRIRPLLTVLGLATQTGLLPAEQFGPFTYRLINGTEVEITDYPSTTTRGGGIPAQIDGKPVTSIGHYSFKYCSKITEVYIPTSITRIGRESFRGCAGLCPIDIPSGVTLIFWRAFHDCSALTSITVDPANPRCSIIDGVLIDASQSQLKLKQLTNNQMHP